MKTRIAALLLAAMMLLCGTAFAQESQPALDNTGLLARVNGVEVPLGDAYAEYQYYAMVYAYQGFTDDEIQVLKQEVADYYVDLELIRQRYKILGLDAELDMDSLKEAAAAEYEQAMEDYLVYINDDGMTEEEALAASKAMLDEDGYDISYFEKMFYDQECLRAVTLYYMNQLEVTEEDVRAYYDDLVAQDKQLVEEDPLYYDVMTAYGERVMYVPEGLRAVKHILVMLSDEDQDALSALEAQLEQVTADLAAAPGDTALLTRKGEIEKAIDDVYATIEPSVDQIMNRLANGEDFIALIEECGEDPGMTYEPYKTEGYLIQADSEQWVIAFRDAAMALEKPGDISSPVRVSYGIHIIRYEYDVPAGGVDYDEIHDELLEEVSNAAFDEYFTGLLEQWRAESEVEIYLENLEDEAKG